MTLDVNNLNLSQPITISDLQKVPKFPQMGIFGMRNFRIKALKLKSRLTSETIIFLEIKQNITLLFVIFQLARPLARVDS